MFLTVQDKMFLQVRITHEHAPPNLPFNCLDSDHRQWPIQFFIEGGEGGDDERDEKRVDGEASNQWEMKRKKKKRQKK